MTSDGKQKHALGEMDKDITRLAIYLVSGCGLLWIFILFDFPTLAKGIVFTFILVCVFVLLNLYHLRSMIARRR